MLVEFTYNNVFKDSLSGYFFSTTHPKAFFFLLDNIYLKGVASLLCVGFLTSVERVYRVNLR